MAGRLKYGIQWPDGIPDHSIELAMWQAYQRPAIRERFGMEKAQFIKPAYRHAVNAIRLLFPEDKVCVHAWMEQALDDYTEYPGVIWWGAASTGKSFLAGLIALLELLANPTSVYICMASTSLQQLKSRSLASSIELLDHLARDKRFSVPFKYLDAKSSIVPTEELPMSKAMIKGVAVENGNPREARAALQGVHLQKVIQIADEADGMCDRFSVVLDARSNLAVCESFKFMALTNPEGLNGPTGEISEPVGGWSSIDIYKETSWVAKSGYKVRVFDAYESPGRNDPKKYPFLPTDETIARTIQQNHGNPDAPNCYTFLRGRPPPVSDTRTVLNTAMIQTYGVRDDVIWNGQATSGLAFDPAFTSGGDNPAVVRFEVGHTLAGDAVIKYHPIEYLKISASSTVPVAIQLSEQFLDLVEHYHVKVENIVVDDSGTQSMADIIEDKLGMVGVLRINYGAAAPEIAVSSTDFTMARLKYKNMATWLHANFLEYVYKKQIKTLPSAAERQLCVRRFLSKQKPIQIESKGEYKKRVKNGQSPDEADTCIMAAALARLRLGLVPGSTSMHPAGRILTSTPYDSERIRAINNIDLEDTFGYETSSIY